MKYPTVSALALLVCAIILFAGCSGGSAPEGVVIEKAVVDAVGPTDISYYDEFHIPQPDAPAADGTLEIIADGSWTVNESSWSVIANAADFPKTITVAGLDDVAGMRLFPSLNSGGGSLELYSEDHEKSCAVGYDVYTTIVDDVSKHSVGETFMWWEGQATLLNEDENGVLLDWVGDRHTLTFFYDDNGQGTINIDLHDGFFEDAELAWSVGKALAENTRVETSGDLIKYDNIKLVFCGGSTTLPLDSFSIDDAGFHVLTAGGPEYTMSPLWEPKYPIENFLELYKSARAADIEKVFPVLAIKDEYGYILQDRSVQYRLYVKEAQE